MTKSGATKTPQLNQSIDDFKEINNLFSFTGRKKLFRLFNNLYSHQQVQLIL